MSQIKHHATIIQSIFAVEISDDEQIPQEPITARITAFTEEGFVSAYRQIRDERDRAAGAMKPTTKPTRARPKR